MKYLALVLVLLFGCAQTPAKIEYKELDYKIVKVLVLNKENCEHYPIIHRCFLDAAKIWAEKLPIHFVVTYDERISGVRIVFAELSDPPYNQPTILGGYYKEPIEQIVLDKDLEENHDIAAYGPLITSVCVHELGHMLGLPHVVGPSAAMRDCLEISSDQEAPYYIMYPYVTPNFAQVIQDLELEYLRKNLHLAKENEHNTGVVTFFTIEEPSIVPTGETHSSP